jgi:hypothetical protein
MSMSGDIIGPAWVVFDPRTGSSGKATQTIYVGVAQPDGDNIYVTTNGGTTWAPLAWPTDLHTDRNPNDRDRGLHERRNLVGRFRCSRPRLLSHRAVLAR